MTVHRVFVQGRIVEALKDFTVPVTLRVLTDAANADHDSFVLGQNAVRAALAYMEQKGQIEVIVSPKTNRELFVYTPFGVPMIRLKED